MNTKYKNGNSLFWSLVGAVLVTILIGDTARSQVTLTDIGATAPTLGIYDISQLSTNGTGNTPGLNYYWDNSVSSPQHSNPEFLGQTFTTGGNPQGYTLTSLAVRTDGGGNNFGVSQSFTLAIYQVSGAGLTNATLVGAYSVVGALNAEGDWLQWTGIGVPLAPNATYAYGFGISSSDADSNWERLSTASGLPYSGGQVCCIPDNGGAIQYSTTLNQYDAVFDIGLSLPASASAVPPIESPSYADVGVSAGQSVTLTATAGGVLPISYQWQTDGGSGQTPTNILGATGTSLVIDTTGWAPGTYLYDFTATNSIGGSTSATVSIVIASLAMLDIGSTTPTPGPYDVSQLLNTPSVSNPDGFNYYTDNGASHNTWCGQTFTTGGDPNGYVMTSLAWKSNGNGSGFGANQAYDLRIYSISDGTATLIAAYTCNGGGTELDWFDFVGLYVPLAPNTLYAYTLGRDATASGWENIGSASGNPYPDGQVCTIPSAGGPVTYGPSGTFDATFDIGLNLARGPSAFLPTYNPDISPIYAGTPVTLSEVAIGAGTLSYQWLGDNGTGGGIWTPIVGGTASNLVLNTTAFAPNSYEYEVVVTNTFGSVTSAPVTLNIIAGSAPAIVTDTTPNPNEGYVGESVAFSASFTGTQPITYQWMVNTGSGPTPISSSSNPTATNTTLVLNNLQSANAGAYTLVANNSVDSSSSSASTLTVLAAPAAPAVGTYGAMVLTEAPVAYWQFNETENPASGILPAYDASGHDFDGLYGSAALNGFDSISGPTPPGFPGFEANNTAVQMSGSSGSSVTVPSLNLDTNTVTIAMWINPSTGEGANTGLFMSRNALDTDAAGLGFGGTVNGSGMAELGYTWNQDSAATYGFNSGLYPVPNQWDFVALVIQPTNTTLYLYYIDPVTLQPDLYSASALSTNALETFSIGTNEIGSDSQDLGTRTFNGSIDDVAVFNTAFTSDQILALFSKGAGLGPVGPSITVAPQSQQVLPGHSVTFSASGVNGTSPLFYQWRFDNTNILDATNLSFTIASPTMADAGTYTLVVSNSVASTNVSAMLTVLNTYGLISWSAPVAITTANATLELPGQVVGAETFGGTPVTVTLSDGEVVSFDAGGIVASTTGAASLTGPAFFQGDTGDANFNQALDQAEVDAGPHTITIYGDANYNPLVVGQQYSVQLFALDDRSGGANTRTAYYEDASAPSDISATIVMDANDYVIGTWTATNTTETIIENLPTGNAGNINALVLRTAPVSVTLNATASAGNLMLTWSQGTLLESTNVTGPWVTNSVTSPYTVPTADAPQMFYRIKLQ
jgi:hypothetical protein